MISVFSSISRNKNLVKWGYCLAFTLLVIWCLWSLVYSPIAWFDEVYFASATHSLITGNGMCLELDHGEPLITYGPIYFWITGLVAKIFGFGVFSFRVTNCIFSFLTVLFLGKLLEELKINKKANYILQLVLLTDAYFFSNAHSGRMEFVALFFVIIAYYLYIKNNINQWARAIAISFLLTLSLLTTPRVVVVALPLAISGLVDLCKQRAWFQIGVYVIIPIVLYGSWILYAYGSINGMIDFLNSTNPNQEQSKSLIEMFVGGKMIIPKTQYPLFILSMITLFYSVYRRKLKEIVLYVAPIVLFFILVNGSDMYSAYVLPFYVILVAMGLLYSKQCGDIKMFKLIKVFLVLCLFINCAVMFVKGVSIVRTKEQRDPRQVTAWIKNNIPYGSKVAGDYKYYYAAIENGCQYKRIDRQGIDKTYVIEDLMDNYQPDFIVLGEENGTTMRSLVIKTKEIDTISNLTAPQLGDGMLERILKMAKVSYTSSYAGCIYRVSTE